MLFNVPCARTHVMNSFENLLSENFVSIEEVKVLLFFFFSENEHHILCCFSLCIGRQEARNESKCSIIRRESKKYRAASRRSIGGNLSLSS